MRKAMVKNESQDDASQDSTNDASQVDNEQQGRYQATRRSVRLRRGSSEMTHSRLGLTRASTMRRSFRTSEKAIHRWTYYIVAMQGLRALT